MSMAPRTQCSEFECINAGTVERLRAALASERTARAVERARFQQLRLTVLDVAYRSNMRNVVDAGKAHAFAEILRAIDTSLAALTAPAETP